MRKLSNRILLASLVLIPLSSCGESNEIRRVLSSFKETDFSPGSEELEDVRLQLAVQDFSFPVYVDTYGSFARENTGIPEDERFHSFLIGGDGRPVFVGNPLGSEKMQDIFQKVLAGTKHN